MLADKVLAVDTAGSDGVGNGHTLEAKHPVGVIGLRGDEKFGRGLWGRQVWSGRGGLHDGRRRGFFENGATIDKTNCGDNADEDNHDDYRAGKTVGTREQRAGVLDFGQGALAGDLGAGEDKGLLTRGRLGHNDHLKARGALHLRARLGGVAFDAPAAHGAGVFKLTHDCLKTFHISTVAAMEFFNEFNSLLCG